MPRRRVVPVNGKPVRHLDPLKEGRRYKGTPPDLKKRHRALLATCAKTTRYSALATLGECVAFVGRNRAVFPDRTVKEFGMKPDMLFRFFLDNGQLMIENVMGEFETERADDKNGGKVLKWATLTDIRELYQLAVGTVPVSVRYVHDGYENEHNDHFSWRFVIDQPLRMVDDPALTLLHKHPEMIDMAYPLYSHPDDPKKYMVADVSEGIMLGQPNMGEDEFRFDKCYVDVYPGTLADQWLEPPEGCPPPPRRKAGRVDHHEAELAYCGA